MRYLKKYENYSTSLLEDIRDICIELEDKGFTVKVSREELPKWNLKNTEVELEDDIYVNIVDNRKVYLSPFSWKDVIEALQRIEMLVGKENLRIFTHREHHNNQEEELKIYGGGLMDLEDNYLDYKIYWIKLIVEVK